jgi:hypothetical protein
MTKTLRLSSLALGMGLLAGCGYSGGFLRDSISSQQIDYRMDVSGVHYVKSVSGTATTGAVFCFIPLSGDLYQTAMQSMQASAGLGPNQMVMNLREDSITRSWLGFYCTRTLTVSGDVIQFTPTAPGAPTR